MIVEDDSISEEVISISARNDLQTSLYEKDPEYLDLNFVPETSDVLSNVLTHRHCPHTMGGGKRIPPVPSIDREEYRVEFEGPDDPYHPFNWSMKRKIITSFCLDYTSLCITFASAVYAPAAQQVADEFNVGLVVAVLGTSVFILGFASGPIVWGPISELYGRKMPTLVSLLGFTLFSFGSATAKDFQTLILCRFFAGFLGSAPWAVVVAGISDLFNNPQRGNAVIVFMLISFTGPFVGPIVGGFFSSSHLGWRWTQYISGIMGAIGLVLDIFVCEETYHPLLLVYKAKALRKSTGNWAIYAIHEEMELNLHEVVTKNISRPIVMLFTEPILLLISIYTAFIYGILYLFLEAYPIVFTGYGFKGGVLNLPYIGLIIGLIIASACITYIFEPRYRRKLAANGGRPISAEAKLPPMIIGGILFPLGIFWFTWSGNYPDRVHWIVPTLSGIFTGYGLLAIFQPAISYLVEVYLTYAASALAAATFVRSTFGAAFPLFSGAMFHNLGTNWAGTLIGCIGLIMVPIPLLFHHYGKQIRLRSNFSPIQEI